jgi:5-methylcytosine-specific restriction protein A
MTRRAMSKARKARIWDAAQGVCHLCGLPIKAGEPWEAEHVVALTCGGSDADDNIRPAHVDCHAGKTKADKAIGAKITRIKARNIGVKRLSVNLIKSKGFTKSEREPKAGKVRIERARLAPRPMFVGE